MKAPNRLQRTIARPIRLSGIGYWSSRDVVVELRPALPNSGITFVRCDECPVRRIRARIENRVESPRRTSLEKHGVSVEMVEHILAALAGLRVDNCEVWVNASEMPAWDGSCRKVVDALLAIGCVEQDVAREVIEIPCVVRVGNEEAWIEAEPSSKPGLTLAYQLDYGTRTAIGRQAFEMRVTPDSFDREVASARTFILEAEAERMRANGLGERVTYRDLLVFGPNGPIDNELRFPNECARHKVLDMVGDLALLETDVQGRITAFRSGHVLNAEIVRQLRLLSMATSRRRSA